MKNLKQMKKSNNNHPKKILNQFNFKTINTYLPPLMLMMIKTADQLLKLTQPDNSKKMKKENKSCITKHSCNTQRNQNQLKKQVRITQRSSNQHLIISRYSQLRTGIILISILTKRLGNKLKMCLLWRILICFRFTNLLVRHSITSSDMLTFVVS